MIDTVPALRVWWLHTRVHWERPRKMSTTISLLIFLARRRRDGEPTHLHLFTPAHTNTLTPIHTHMTLAHNPSFRNEPSPHHNKHHHHKNSSPPSFCTHKSQVEHKLHGGAESIGRPHRQLRVRERVKVGEVCDDRADHVRLQRRHVRRLWCAKIHVFHRAPLRFDKSSN